MSKKVLNSLIADAFGKGLSAAKIQKIARGTVDSLGLHYISVTEEDIYNLLVFNYLAIVRSRAITNKVKKLNDASRAEAATEVLKEESSSTLRADARIVAKKIYAGFAAEYKRFEKNPEYQAVDTGSGKIEVFQPRNQVYKIKKTIISLLEATSTETLLKALTTNQRKTSFSRRTQFLHQGKTVGVQVAETLRDAKISATGEKAAAITVIAGIIENIQYAWEADDSINRKGIQVVGTVGQTLSNKPGQEPTDWKNLRPAIEKSLFEELNKMGSKFATEKGSQPFDERAAKSAANALLNIASKTKNIRTSPFKIDKPTGSKGRVPSKKKTKKAVPGTISMVARKAKIQAAKETTPTPAAAPLQLLGVLNKQLPETVKDNMGPPRLENQTGRFASSVKVTDITQTPQGFPSIGYTYDRYRYGTFEAGNRKGSLERDPRRLIDASIREIAVQFAMGRFYTRRV
jgi:hypothetical protein